MALFTSVAIEDIPAPRERRCHVHAILSEFLESGMEIAEFNWKEATNYESVNGLRSTFHSVISREKIPVKLITRHDHIFFARKGGNE